MSDDALRLPYAHLNLRRNPFGEVPADARPSLAVVDMDEWIDSVRASTVVEVVGAPGRGKSTHLRALVAQMDGAAYVQIDKDCGSPALPDAPTLCVDEAQFLAPRRRRALYRSDVCLALGTPVSLAAELDAAGRAVHTVSLAERPVDAPFLRQMVSRRLEWARRDDGAVPHVRDAALTALLDRYGDNLRAIEHHLYNVIQNLDTVRPIVPADLDAADAPPTSILDPAQPPVRTSTPHTLWVTFRRTLHVVRSTLKNLF